MSATVTGTSGTAPETLDVIVSGTPTRVILLEHGDTTPPTGTPAGSVLIEKG